MVIIATTMGRYSWPDPWLRPLPVRKTSAGPNQKREHGGEVGRLSRNQQLSARTRRQRPRCGISVPRQLGRWLCENVTRVIFLWINVSPVSAETRHESGRDGTAAWAITGDCPLLTYGGPRSPNQVLTRARADAVERSRRRSVRLAIFCRRAQSIATIRRSTNLSEAACLGLAAGRLGSAIRKTPPWRHGRR
jgi:hypothetical protein